MTSFIGNVCGYPCIHVLKIIVNRSVEMKAECGIASNLCFCEWSTGSICKSICLLYQYFIQCKRAKGDFRSQGWNSLKEQARRLSKINIQVVDKIYYYTKVQIR